MAAGSLSSEFEIVAMVITSILHGNEVTTMVFMTPVVNTTVIASDLRARSGHHGVHIFGYEYHGVRFNLRDEKYTT